ncbi:hypothetical protein GCM10009117_16360 [Gangjinia marincola]|uniref:Uncharacterized protein n=1 Tax=Gangjinia marincola TaxID=578463 RepID=A0ABN1MH98_9FLAO
MHRDFRIKDIPTLTKKTYSVWLGGDPWRSSAVIAYYSILSLPPLLVLLINLVGVFYGTEIVQGRLTNEIASVLGLDTAEFIQDMVTESLIEDKSTVSTIVGIAMLIFGATGVFYQMQISLNQVWLVTEEDKGKIKNIIIDRARSFAFILTIGFLLLISFVLTALLSTFTEYLEFFFPDTMLVIAYLLDVIISLGFITVLFALMFKYLPDTKVTWHMVWKGAFISSALFALGKYLLALYFSKLEPGSAYGAAGTVVLILLWVSYSSLILFFGAAFTKAYADHYGLTLKKNNPDKTPEKEMEK